MTPLYLLLGASTSSLSDLSQELFQDFSPTPHIQLLTGDPRPQLEELSGPIQQGHHRLARVIALVDASQLESRRELQPWVSLLTHFADVLLLSQSRPVSPAWLTAFRRSLQDRPMEIFLWPQCLSQNADTTRQRILFPEARRLSQAFEPADASDLPIFQGDDEDDPHDATPLDDDDDAPVDEPYFARDAAGRYKIKILAP